ncbi:hypothetical protein [Novosphingobium sp. 9U]|uniref:hypothetical protein n=1 Tax=Novosphingobium sp. 9U TaxID=2653158 RepID=UPI0012F3AD64|nr:hypothetical protein [Novosphingobium sp. 9U]VWX51114.1 hypothetical protein NOVOSPHI9U_370102 [Novosphingobium sp. 9U]
MRKEHLRDWDKHQKAAGAFVHDALLPVVTSSEWYAPSADKKADLSELLASSPAARSQLRTKR